MEPLATEEADAELLLNAMPTATPLAAQRKASFWQNSRVPPCWRRSTATILPGIRRREDDLTAGSAVAEHRHEQRLAGEDPLTR